MVHLVFYKTCATEVFLVKLRCFYRVYKPEILVFSYPLLASKDQIEHTSHSWSQNVTAYVVLSGFLSSEPGEPEKNSLFGLQKTFSLASGKLCCTISHVHTPFGEL